jgi:TonB family protein
MIGVAGLAASPRANGRRIGRRTSPGWRRQVPGGAVSDTLGQWAYRVGGGISPPKPIKKVEPQFVDSARRAKISQDMVMVSMIVAADGLPRHLRIARPGIDPFEDRAAIAAVAQWRFSPALKGEEPVPVWIMVEVTFVLGVPKHPVDWKKATEAYEKDAGRGQGEAQCSLGNIYYRQGDFEHAKEWYTLAANQGLSEAEYGLGTMYEKGEGVTKDQDEARRWLEKSAAHTDERLGIMFYQPEKDSTRDLR